VLSQNGYVVCYESRKLKEHEINYAWKKWRHYLMGKMFELRIDHSGLKYLFE
jgi:hypothetical protein